jgi:hypothetical protein
MRDYRLQGHPAILMFDSEGRETGRVIGSQPAAEIEVVLKEAL